MTETASQFLATRRSRPAKLLGEPAPDRDALLPLLEAALRVPDHGKLEPWRLVVLSAPALRALAAPVREAAAARGLPEAEADKAASVYETSPLAVAVIESPVESDAIPLVEQTYSAGCVCLSLLNAALAAGWGANWLSGWPAHDRDLMARHLGLAPGERVAGIVHIGTARSAPPERPRPDLAAKVEWR
ncbi:nitroreductase [Hasllibacter halocynthiae]|uniref:Putative NAD(P)H nitroreductase n=1 Tax=Hasllibacter halocynthiae TaxID=595589 RepID=A0A2T0X0T0_9RHOB|nr:nitroreductase family protein [Hasllibacter halocynthiae]PRY92563.1 nitroreductase [Hasllibacter halocynthiae]